MENTASCLSAGLAIGWLTMFVVGTDLFVVSPLLPLIAASFRISPAGAGLCVSAFSLSYVTGAPLLGHLADRIGRKRMLCGCLVAFAAANAATGLAPSFDWFLTGRFFAGAAAAGVSPSVYAIVGSIAPPGRRATWLSLAVSGLLMSLIFGAPAAALAGAAFGWPGTFLGLAAASLALTWASHVGWPDEHPVGPAAGETASLPVRALAARLAPMVAWSTALYSTYTYLGSGLAASGLSATGIAQVVVLYGAGAIAGLLLGGRLADRLDSKTIAGISLAGLAFSLLSLRFAIHDGLLAGAAFGLTSMVAQLFFPAQQGGLVRDFPTVRAAALAWNNSMLFVGILCGSLIGGQALLQGGFEADLAVSAVVALIGWVINLLVVPRGRPASGDPRDAPGGKAAATPRLRPRRVQPGE